MHVHTKVKDETNLSFLSLFFQLNRNLCLLTKNSVMFLILNLAMHIEI